MARRLDEEEDIRASTTPTNPSGTGGGINTGDTSLNSTMNPTRGQTAANPPMRDVDIEAQNRRDHYNLPGFDARMNRLNAAADQYGARGAPQAADDSAYKQYQSTLAERLQRQVGGEESQAQGQFRQMQDANMAQQRAMAASASPQNAAMASRLAMQNVAGINQGTASQAAQLGLQERNQAAQALTGLAGQARGQDMQGSQFNVGAQLQQTGMNDQAAMQARQQELANAELQQRGTMGYETNQTNRYGIDQNKPKEAGFWDKVLDTTVAAAPVAAMAFSDERLKKNISTPGDGELDRMIASMEPKKYEYKDERMGQGERMGPMAQDIERGGGEHMVHETPHGKALDVHGSLTTALGLIGRLGDRIDQLEGKAPRKMAEGGIVTQPTDAIVGEAGPEAIVPLPPGMPPDMGAAKRAKMQSTMAPHPSMPLAGQLRGADEPTTQDKIQAFGQGLGKIGEQSEDKWARRIAKLSGVAAGIIGKHAEQKKQDTKLASMANVKLPGASGSSFLGRYGAAPPPMDAAPIGGFKLRAPKLAAPQVASIRNDEELNKPGYAMGPSRGIGTSPSYAYMAQGGIVDEPTRAIIGENGPEAVIPLKKLPDIMARLAGRTKQTATKSSGGKAPRGVKADTSPDAGSALPAPRFGKQDEAPLANRDELQRERKQKTYSPEEMKARSKATREQLMRQEYGPPPARPDELMRERPEFRKKKAQEKTSSLIDRLGEGVGGPTQVAGFGRLANIVHGGGGGSAAQINREYGPGTTPAAEGPAPPGDLRAPEWKPRTQKEWEMWVAAQNARGHEVPKGGYGPQFNQSMNGLTQGEWMAYLRGLGLK